MIRWIITQSLRFRFLMVAFGGALMFFGIAPVPNMPVDVFPEFAPPRVEIQTPCLGLSAAETESLVTVPLEQALQGVPGLDELQSKSVSQLSSIELIFTSGTDLITARQLVNERLQTIVPTLPTWAAPPFILQPLSATSRVMKIGLSSDTLSTIDMSMTAYWKIRARLLRVPGVANVAIWGERIDMLTVQVKPDKLKEHGVTLEQVMDVTADSLDSGLLQYTNSSVVGKGGFIETPNQRLNVRHVLPIASPDDLGEVVVNNKDGKSLRLADVADIVQDHQPLVGDAVINGGEGLMLIVEKLPWSNALQVTEGVEAAMAELAPGLPGMQVDTSIFRPATFVEEAVDNLTDSLLLGLAVRGAAPRPVPAELARRAGQCGHHPGLAHGGDPDPALARSSPSTRWCSRDSSSPWAPSSTTPSSTSRTSSAGSVWPGPCRAPRDEVGGARGGARGPQRDRLRLLHRGVRTPPDLLPDRAHRVVTQAARHGIRPCCARLPDGGAAPDTGDVPHPAVPRSAERTPLPPRARAAPRLRAPPDPGGAPAPPRVHCRWRDRRIRDRRLPHAGASRCSRTSRSATS